MKTLRVLYHLMRADFLERSRSYNFLVILCLSVFLGYAVNMGRIVLRFNTCREIFDTALVGVMMAIAIGFFLGFFGFYLVKGSIGHDEVTGIGQILAATPLRRVDYVFSKWLSHLLILGLLLILLAGMTAFIQALRIPRINMPALLMPFFLATLPFLVFVAALAVLFETISFLKGGIGNLVYFFLFIFILMLVIDPSMQSGLLSTDPSGIRLLLREIKTAGLDCGGYISLADLGRSMSDIHWNGVTWGQGFLFSRGILLAVALCLVAASAVFFNRFSASTDSWSRRRVPAPKAVVDEKTDETPHTGQSIRLTKLPAGKIRFNLLGMTLTEIRLMLKGVHWGWWAGALFLWLANLFPFGNFTIVWTIFMAIWPLLLWSKMGLREAVFQTDQLVFSCPRPVWRLVFSAWLAGVLITAMLWSSMALRLGLSNQPTGLLAWGLAVLLIPSLALASGIWTGESKVFEVFYLIAWYLGLVNRLPVLDFLGLTPQAIVYQSPIVVLLIVVTGVVLAFAGRHRQVMSG